MTRSVNMELTNDATLQLISEYQKHVVLWDRTHKFYKLVNKSPDARNRRVTASRSATGTAFRNDVFFLLILGPTKLINASKSE